MRALWLLLVPASAFLISCSSEDPKPGSNASSDAVTKTVGPEGATIEVGGATVTIPQGALTAPVSIGIVATGDSPPAQFRAVSRLFRCSPSGTSFAVPVTMKMPFTENGRAVTMFWSTDAKPEFEDVGGSATGGFMTATVRHFSEGFVGEKN